MESPAFHPGDLAHVFWMGGSPCSGKSSIADALAEQDGFTLYRCDDAFYRHAQIITPEQQPVFTRIMGYASEDLWMRPVAQQTADEIAIYREEFPLILTDLIAMPRTRPILAEGAALLPDLVAPLLLDAHQAIWIVPTASFQHAHYRQREWAKEVVSACSDPEQAFQNWMERDVRFAVTIRREAEARDLRVIVVDGNTSIAENTRQVRSHYVRSHYMRAHYLPNHHSF